MMRYFLFAVLLLASQGRAVEPGTPEAAPKQDLRMARELQSRAWGTPRLGNDAERGEVALALAEMGLIAAMPGSPAGEGLGAQDYDALHALLQRYRDDLLKLGLSSSELEAQLKTLELRSRELKERVDKLKPKDGLKIHARLSSFIDDMHILGASGLVGPPGSFVKPAGKGLRYQVGGAHAELRLAGTRGLLSAYAQIDMLTPWGLRSADSSVPFSRKIYAEMRFPVAIQFGDIDLKTSPLTFWRNDENHPFEPEPFKARRRRIREDMMLAPERWPVQGGRVSTDILLFGAQPLLLESTLFIAGNAGAPIYTFSATNVNPANNNVSLVERFNTYGESWRVSLPFASGAFTLSNNGLLFWDETATRPSGTFRALNHLVYSGEADLKAGIFRAGAEYAISNYAAPVLFTVTPPPAPLTGTAMTYHAGIETKEGFIRAFGRMVDNSFHAPGAQGRTIDEAYQALGPFATEQIQINSEGNIGIDPLGRIPISYASRINDVMIPPGTLDGTLPFATGVGSPWVHLLDFGPLENIDPYGAATPDRTGFGAELDYKLFDGTLRPKASYESFKHVTAFFDPAKTFPGFSMTRMRGGLFIDLKPKLGWPLRAQAGYTMDESTNGTKNLAGKPFTLTSTLLDGGLEWDFVPEMGINFGYRHMDITGMNGRFNINFINGLAFDTLAGGLWWNPIRDVRFDAVYSQLFITAPNVAGANLEVDEATARMTIVF